MLAMILDIDLSELEMGVYSLNIMPDKRIVLKKLIVE